MPELVTFSLADYEALALSLARDPQMLAGLRARLAANRLTSPLYDAARFTRSLEAAWRRMIKISRARRKPESFTVPA